MGKKDVLRTLPEGDYELTPIRDNEPKQLLTELPKGNYEIQQPKSGSDLYHEHFKNQENQSDFENIINNIPDLDDSKKQTIRDLALKGVKGEELSNSILTLQGKHSHQNESETGITNIKGTSSKYYFNDKGIPVPLKSSERPPAGYEVASTWGTQQEANDDNTITSLGKHLWNGVLGAAEGIVLLPELAYRSTTGKESDWFHKIENNVEAIKFKTPEYEKKPLYNIEDLVGIKDYAELFKKDRWIPSMDAVQGAILGGLETGLSFVLGTKGLGAAGKLAGVAGKTSGLLKTGVLADEVGNVLNKGSQLTNFIEGTSNAGKLGQAYTTSYVQNYNEAYDAATEAGLEGSDKLAFAGVATIPLAMLEVAFGTEGLLTKNMLAKDAKKEMFKKLGEGIIKDASGNITEESLQKLFKESVINGTRLNKSFVRELGSVIGEESLTEAGQAITIETAKEIYDKVSKDQKFNTEVFSVENVGKYINEALSGGIGAMGIGAYGVNQKRRINKEQAKNSNAFEIVKNGQIDNFNKNVNLALENGDISKEDADAAKFKVRTYQEYYDQTKDTKLNDEDKKRVFELTFEKSNLENQIPTQYEEDKLNAIEQAKINIKKKQAKDIQEELNKLFLKDDLLRKETTAATKTIEEVDKHLDPEAGKSVEGKKAKLTGNIKELYEKYSSELGSLETNPKKKEVKPEVVETRGFEEIPFAEWNEKRDSQKFKVLSEHLDTTNNTQAGELKLMKGGEGEITNDTVHIKLPNDKWVIMASSATQRKTKLRGHLHIENLPDDFDGHKVVIKPTRLTTGRIVLPVYNAETGKHVGYVREDNTGKANEKLFTKRAEKIGAEKAAQIEEKETEELQHLKTVKLTKNEIEATNRPVTQNQPSVEKVTPETQKTQPKAEEIVKPTREEYIANKIEDLKADESADYNPELESIYKESFNKQYDREYEPKIAESEAEQDIAEATLSKQDNPKLEPSVKAIESKANSDSEVKLVEAVKESVALIESATDVVNLPISEISVDEKRFQNRDELDKDIVKSISENFDENQFDPIVVWKQGDKTFVLAGHHRFEGAKQAGKTSVKVRYFNGTEAQAIEFAKEKSNANRTMESPVERAKIYRDKLERGESKKSVEELAKQNEGKNASFYLNIAALNPNGMAIQTYNSFKNSADKVAQREIERLLDWIGEVRKAYPELTDQHEQELFEFLFNKESSKRITTKSDFKQKITTIVGTLDFDATKPLNIARFKYKTEGESLYEKEVGALKARIEATQDKITNLKDRFINPKNPEYIAPTHKDYESLKKLADDKIAELNNKQQSLNTELLNLYKEKGKYIEGGSNQGELFQKESDVKGNIEKVIKTIQKAIPGVKIVYDENLDAAGKWSPSTKTITINPYYAGLDTPIHEAGHILIDLMGGMENNIIRKAIEQLRETDLYKETKERYPELSEEELGYEVLAEAIGREGAEIFDKETQKNVFMKYLEYIFNRLKQLFGIDKNVAKSLAQQIIGGIAIKNIKGIETGKEQFSKKKFTPFEEKSKEQQIKALTLSFEQYSREELKRDLITEANNLNEINEALENPDLTEEQASILNQIKDAITYRKKQDLKAWFDYREDMKWASTLDDDIRGLEEKVQSKEITEQEFMDGLIELYNVVNGFQKRAKETVESNLMGKMAYALFQQGKETLKKNEKFIEEVANKADISVKDVWLKNLGHMTEKVPELQVFGKLFDEAAFDKVEEAKEKKNTFEKLGTLVIKEANKALGIAKTALSTFSSDSAKYFEYMDNGEGGLITLQEAKDKNLSDAQIEFLKFNRELIAEHQGMIMDDSVYNMPLQVLKTDPTFKESFKQDGITQAFSNFLGTNYNLKQVRIPFKNPETGITETTEFGNIEQALVKYGKKGVAEKAKSLALMLKYNRNARVQLKKGVNYDEKDFPLLIKNNSQFSIDNNGVLSSKFDKPRDKTRGYSKDFYRAGIEFIDDAMHVKHMSKLVPLINSIEYLNKNGFEEHIAKENVVKWIDQWRDMHLFKNPKQTIPEIDATLKFMRRLTSMSVMMFNVPASIMNVAIGVYNNWRAENTEKIVTGHKRLFKGAVNGYAIDILRKYDAVSVDYDSNPKFSFGRIFESIGYGLIRWGEFQIQGSMFLGLMTKEEYDSFEYKENKQGVKELVVKKELNSKPVDEKALKKKLIEYKKRVSDIQGKYGETDQRNIANNELGKSVLQFKTYLPDAIKIRFGSRYIDSNGKTVEGSWRSLTGEGIKELRAQIQTEGFAKAFFTKEEEKSEVAKNALANLKGLMAVVLFAALSNQDDDDKKRSKASIDAENMLSQLMLIFDPKTLKWTVTRPVASMGTIEKFLDAADALLKLDADKLEKNIMKVIPANKALKAKEVFE